MLYCHHGTGIERPQRANNGDDHCVNRRHGKGCDSLFSPILPSPLIHTHVGGVRQTGEERDEKQ